jgi:hypothetical protein
MWTDPEQCIQVVVWCHVCPLVKADWHELQNSGHLALFWLGEKLTQIMRSSAVVCICSMILFVVFVQEKKNDFRFLNESFCDLISLYIYIYIYIYLLFSCCQLIADTLLSSAGHSSSPPLQISCPDRNPLIVWHCRAGESQISGSARSKL